MFKYLIIRSKRGRACSSSLHGSLHAVRASIIVVAAVYLGATNRAKVLSFEPMFDAIVMVHMEARQCQQLVSILVATQADHALVLVILRICVALSVTLISLLLHKFVFWQSCKHVLLQGSLTLLHMQLFHHLSELLPVHATRHPASAAAQTSWSKHSDQVLAITRHKLLHQLLYACWYTLISSSHGHRLELKTS